jgi:hypothetical protein
MTITNIYVLKLEHGKYYLGTSNDPSKTLEEHREGLGPNWTQFHRPIQLEHVYPFVSSSELDFYVKRYMIDYGVENVRGGTWQSDRLLDTEKQRLRDELATQRGCILC